MEDASIRGQGFKARQVAASFQPADSRVGGVEAGSELTLGQAGFQTERAKEGTQSEGFKRGLGYHVIPV